MIYRPEIDGLRAIAVLAIVFFHAGFTAVPGGYVGVDVFFVISGYLITTIIESQLATEQFSFKAFYIRRARRILPALFVMVLATFIAGWFWFLPADLKRLSQSMVAVDAFIANIYFALTTGYFDNATELKPLIHTWSLAVEEQFYLFFPILLWCLRKQVRTTRIFIFAVLALVSLGLAQLTNLSSSAFAFYGLPTRAFELLIGALLAFAHLQWPHLKGSRLVNESASALGVLLILGSVMVMDAQTPAPGFASLLPTSGAALIIGFARPGTFVQRFLAQRLLLGMGLISYSVYLWHQPIFAFAHYQLDLAALPIGLTWGLLLLTLGIAYLSWRWIESPARQKNSSIKAKRFWQVLLSAWVLIFVLGISGVMSLGFQNRYSVDDQRMLALPITDGSEYIPTRFNAFINAPFAADSPKRKVLLIGDSVAQDLINAVESQGANAQIQWSTRHIYDLCGNLYLPRETFVSEISATRCVGSVGLVEDTQLEARLMQADEIWLASNWPLWVAKRLPQSIAALSAKFHKPVLVFGPRNFGYFRLEQFLNQTPSTRAALRNPIDPTVLAVSSVLRQTIAPTQYVDILQILCDEKTNTCPLFNSQGELLSFDGVHLTRAGAQYVGERLKGLPQLSFDGPKKPASPAK